MAVGDDALGAVWVPGMTFGELARALDAPKSSVHGFMSGLLAQGWLYEADHRLYLRAGGNTLGCRGSTW